MRTVCITMGDPNGLGPELVSRHFGLGRPDRDARFVIIGPETALTYHTGLNKIAAFHERLPHPDALAEQGPGVYLLEPEGLAGFLMRPGEPHVSGGAAAGKSLDLALSLLMRGPAQALVTCPLNKATLREAGYPFPGHTEFLAEKSGVGAEKVCMHLAGSRLRVSLVTTHPCLADVPMLVTEERVLRCLELTWAHVQSLGLDGPLAVCGLNPHAGEGGLIGCEESRAIAPAIARAREQGVDCEGPLPGDTVFHFAAQGDYAAVLAMYHDQGLAPLKLLHFSEAVNVTLGLPFPRTSPDHGTGYDLVGKDQARISSFQNALELADIMAGWRTATA